MTGGFQVDASRLRVSGVPLEPESTVSVLLGGRSIWSFRLPEPSEDGVFTVSWPAALRTRFRGRAALALSQGSAVVAAERSFVLTDDDEDFVLEEPVTGVPLVVNKWGRVARSFAGRESALLDEVFDEAVRLVDEVRASTGIELFVTGGTLLGPVRDGRILPSDDDADLAYLSSHENPSDVVLETFDLERALETLGYEVVRHSNSHLQIMFPGRSVTDRFYIDIFTYFVCNGFFHGPFHARAPSDSVAILPLRPVHIGARDLPGPADPASLLAAIYGESWRTPDPAFRFVTPPAAARRFHSWLGHFDVDRENWEDHHRGVLAGGGYNAFSEFAEETSRRMPQGCTVLELGCGLGADARYFASTRREVLAVDFSRPAVHAGTTAATAGALYRFKRVNLISVREVAALRREIAGEDDVVVYARRLFDAMPRWGWGSVLRLIRNVLADVPGTAFAATTAGPRTAEPVIRSAFVEVCLDDQGGDSEWQALAPVDMPEFERAVADAGLVITRRERVVDGDDGRLVARMQIERIPE